MIEPVVFISRHRIKEGELDAFRQFFREGTPLVEQDKPQTVFFFAYLNEDGTEVMIVHVFPDAGGMDLHMEGAAERARGAYEFLEPLSMAIYGSPSEQAVEAFRQMTGEQVDLILAPQPLGGFLRLG